MKKLIALSIVTVLLLILVVVDAFKSSPALRRAFCGGSDTAATYREHPAGSCTLVFM